jgi:N-methylhydantoinase A
MSYTIDVDVGGTFMDFFVSGDGKHITSKVPTTTYELGVGFIRGIEDCAVKLGKSADELLTDTESVRYATTIGTNAMLQRKGPNLGLITTAGYQDIIFIGRGRQWADGMPAADVKDMTRIEKPSPLISRTMVVGIRERIDCFGNIIAPLVKEEVLEKIRYLVDKGARGFVICLLWSFLNPIHEREIKRIIEEEYPETYLGNMPIILSSEISPKEGEYTRTMTALVNGYMHSELVEELSSLGESLREKGYTRPMLLVHNTGGSKKVSRSMAVNTHNASPVAGLCGALYMSNLYDLPNVVYTDVGGTSFDMGLITGGALRSYDLFPVIDRWRTQLPGRTRFLAIGLRLVL